MNWKLKVGGLAVVAGLAGFWQFMDNATEANTAMNALRDSSGVTALYDSWQESRTELDTVAGRFHDELSRVNALPSIKDSSFGQLQGHVYILSDLAGELGNLACEEEGRRRLYRAGQRDLEQTSEAYRIASNKMGYAIGWFVPSLVLFGVGSYASWKGIRQAQWDAREAWRGSRR